VTRETVSRSENLLAVGRFGVGYDRVDVQACTEADVLVFITAGAVDRSMAEAIVTWMLSLTHHVRIKDELVRRGEWDRRSGFMGKELRDRTLGVVGLGGIGRALVRLLAGFGMKPPIAFDPYLDLRVARELGVKIVDLDTLMGEADFVAICCPLNDETRGLIGAPQIGRMKRDAYLINTARGGIVDEDALFDALNSRSISGAGVDVFEDEPLSAPHRLGELENVLLAPHSIGWTDELFRDIWHALCQGMIDLSRGKRPNGVVNPEVLQKETFCAKWGRLAFRAKANGGR
jgi:phosphoglycerate dehydrogenase-like enzyme